MIITTASAYARPGSPGQRRCTWGRWVAVGAVIPPEITRDHRVNPCHIHFIHQHFSVHSGSRLLWKPLVKKNSHHPWWFCAGIVTYADVSLLFFDDRGTHVLVRRWDVVFFLDRLSFLSKSEVNSGSPSYMVRTVKGILVLKFCGFLNEELTGNWVLNYYGMDIHWLPGI